jgi:hypothetical protein
MATNSNILATVKTTLIMPSLSELLNQYMHAPTGNNY